MVALLLIAYLTLCVNTLVLVWLLRIKAAPSGCLQCKNYAPSAFAVDDRNQFSDNVNNEGGLRYGTNRSTENSH
jgi:hypothetical protein